MSIAEKLAVIAENEQKVYDAGYAAGQAAGGGGGDSEQLAYDRGHEDGWHEGKQAEYDRFWDAYQNNGSRKNYKAAFNGQYWSDKNFDPKYDLIVTNANTMFQESLITGHEKILSADFSKCTTFVLAFHSSAIEELGIIDFASAGSNIGQVFQNAKVKKIAKIIVYEGNTFSTSVFSGAASLTDVTFEGILASSISLAWSPLNKASILSCFSVLSDAATGRSASFKKSAVDTAFETSEGAADGSTSEEWLALVATKPNWTISLA